MSAVITKTKHPYISMDSRISRGQPVIKGTRIKVMDIVIKYEFMGKSPDEIIDEYPPLRLEQVHDALSYYYENKKELDEKYREDQLFIKELKKRYPSKLKSNLK